MHCLPMTHKIIMQASVSYPLHTHNGHDENEILKKVRLSTCIMKQSSLLKQMAQYFYWGPSLLGAEFVRGRVCQGPSLSGAEMSRNRSQSYSDGSVLSLKQSHQSKTGYKYMI